MKVTDHDVDVERHLASPGAKSVGIGFDQHPGCVGTGPGHADAARVERAYRTEDAVGGVVGVSAHDSARAAVSQKSCQLFGVDAGVDSLPVVTTWRRVHTEKQRPVGQPKTLLRGQVGQDRQRPSLDQSATRPADGSGHRRMALNEVEVADCLRRGLVRRWLLPGEDVPVRVARNEGDARQVGEDPENLDWPRAEQDQVAEGPPAVDLEPLRVGENCPESDRVAMDVRDDPEPHDRQRTARVRPPNRPETPALGSAVRLPRDGEQVCAESEDGRLGFDESDCTEDDLAVGLVRPATVEVAEPSHQPFDPDQIDKRQSGRGDLLRELFRAVEERRREPVGPVLRVRVAAVGEVAPHDLTELGVEEELTREAVEQRGEPADGRDGDHATRPDDAPGFLEDSDAVGLFVQVVERAEDEHDVEAAAGERQPARVAYLRGEPSVAQAVQRLGDMAWGDIDEGDGMAVRQQPVGVHPGPAADVEDECGRGRQMPTKDLLGPYQLELGKPA